MPRIQSTLSRDYQCFSSLSPEERNLRMEGWRSIERCIEDGSYHASAMRALRNHRKKYGDTYINSRESVRIHVFQNSTPLKVLQQPMVLPSLEKRLLPPPAPRVPTAYEHHTKIYPIQSGISIQIVPRSSTHLDLFFLDQTGERVQIPSHLELINSADMRPVSTYSIQPDMPYSMWTILKSERYALVDLDAGKVIHHLKFRWDIRVICNPRDRITANSNLKSSLLS